MTIPADFNRVPPGIERPLRALEAAGAVAKPRALVLGTSGSTLVSWGDVNLPIALMGVSTLFTLAMVLREIGRGAMTPETPISDLLPQETISGLCVVRGEDLSPTVTVEHLMSHRSGINDYFSTRGGTARSLREQTLGGDRAWSPAQALEIARHYRAPFAPGAKGKLHYSLTNYLLLGEILQESTGMSFEELVNLRIVSSLGLANTFVFTPRHFHRYFAISPVLHNAQVVRNPRALASLGPAGSIISSATDMGRFLLAFSRGELFSPEWNTDLLTARLRLRRGVSLARGVMVLGPTRAPSPLVGMSGSSGAVALMNTGTGDVGFATTNTLSLEGASSAGLAAIMTTVAGPAATKER